MGNAGSAPQQAKNAVDGAEAEARRAPPSTVRFVPEAAGNQAKQPPPIKLEEEGGALPPPAAEDDMPPRNLWQVYAVGAFIVLRWAWAKWKNDKKDSSGGGSPDGSS